MNPLSLISAGSSALSGISGLESLLDKKKSGSGSGDDSDNAMTQILNAVMNHKLQPESPVAPQ